jgi:hypothetical protein
LQPQWRLVQLRRWSLATPEYKRASCFAGAGNCMALSAAGITALPTAPGVIEIEFKTGVRLRICGRVDTPIVSAVMQALIGPEKDTIQTAEHNDERER